MRKERPILYSTPMVQAKLEGRKNKTRRTKDLDEINEAPDEWTLVNFGEYTDNVKRIKKYGCLFQDKNSCDVLDVPCPYGKPGDILWARESFCWSSDYHDCGIGCEYGCNAPGAYFKADCLDNDEFKWKPSIHMPKRVARIYDEIVSIRVERLQDITEDDCFQEGIDAENEDYCAAEHYVLGGSPIDPCPPARFAYAALWNRINGPGSWDLNPWVWVIETKTLSTTGRPEELNKPIALTSI